MADIRLSRLHRIDEIGDEIRHSPGVYLFYETNGGPVRYVGRSDSSLLNRIANRDYRYFKCKHCSSAIQAYIEECDYWHKHQNTIDNSAANGGNHPARSEGSNRKCPVCGR
jgi:hypothetical protein